MEIELERTFLLKYKPEGLDRCKSVEISDVYFPQSVEHPVLRLRKKGDKRELTKKFPIDGKDSSEQEEHTIILSEKEFEEFFKLEGKELRKIRYYYPVGGLTAEVDVYQDKLRGLCVVDFEFKTKEQKNKFLMPNFCLCEVSQDKTFAAGLLAGKKYGDIESFLKSLNYKKKLK
jgi:CYTH domain-containing protein